MISYTRFFYEKADNFRWFWTTTATFLYPHNKKKPFAVKFVEASFTEKGFSAHFWIKRGKHKGLAWLASEKLRHLQSFQTGEQTLF